MTRGVLVASGFWALIAWFMPAAVSAQPAPRPLQTATPVEAAEPSRLWIVGGGTFATVRGDCQTCEEETPYRHAAGVLANIGIRVNPRLDVGAEVFWIPVDAEGQHIRTTHLDAIAQFRPWSSRGFFFKGGAGMAFVRNWVDAVGPDAINSKALSVVIGGGWSFRPAERVGLQLFASQHAAAIGDLQRADASVPDVMGNFWAIGAALVVR